MHRGYNEFYTWDEEGEEDEELEIFPLSMGEKCDAVGMHPSEFE